MFTAIAVIQLIEQGKLNYQDKIGKVLPDYPNKEVAGKVTIRHLLSHMSGLTNSQRSTEKEQNGPQRSPRTVKASLESFVNEPLNFEPGSKFDYSNNGFVLLGAIIEKVSGEDYYDYIRDHVFKPAGMSHSDFYDLDNDPPNVATGYMDGPNRTRLSNIFVVGAKGNPAGGAYSTVGDLLKFSIALRSHKLLKQKSLEDAWTPKSGVREGGRQYGYGFEISNVNGKRAIGHSGGWFGITNQFEMYPDLGYTIVILTNIDDEPSSISRKFREWLLQGRM
jgi:D-alanyl-D-alanine carboxypeptidase